MREFTHGGNHGSAGTGLDFSANINPLGMPAGALEAALKGVHQSVRYPDPANRSLTEKLSRSLKIPGETIRFGNGAAELLMAAVRAQPSDCFLIPVPSFLEYERAAASTGNRIRFLLLPEEEDFAFTWKVRDRIVDITREELRTGGTVTVILANPNNPTGKCIPDGILRELCDYFEEENIRYLVDESFLPFVPDADERSVIPLVAGRKTGAVIRSFTKICGMPGLRLGYLVTGDARWRDGLDRGMQPWTVSLPAQMAGEAALGDPGFIRETRSLILREKPYLQNALKDGLAERVYEGEAPFILFRADPGTGERLRSRKIFIRDCRDFRGLEESYFRIGIRTHEENRKLIDIWRSCR